MTRLFHYWILGHRQRFVVTQHVVLIECQCGHGWTRW